MFLMCHQHHWFIILYVSASLKKLYLTFTCWPLQTSWPETTTTSTRPTRSVHWQTLLLSQALNVHSSKENLDLFQHWNITSCWGWWSSWSQKSVHSQLKSSSETCVENPNPIGGWGESSHSKTYNYFDQERIPPFTLCKGVFLPHACHSSYSAAARSVLPLVARRLTEAIIQEIFAVTILKDLQFT